MTDHENGWYLEIGYIFMSIKEIVNQQTMLVVSPADLKEFALTIIEEMKNRPTENEHLFTPKEFAERHGVDVSTLWRWKKMGILKPTKIGGKVWYKETDLKKDECV